MNRFTLETPATRAEVLALLAEHGEQAQLIAGGTGLINLMKQRLVFPEVLVSLHQVEDLPGLSFASDGLRAGAGVRLAELERAGELAAWPGLAEALGEVASPRIRQMATVGGALAHADPHQDTPAILMALEAQVVIESPRGTRSLPLGELYQDFYQTTLRADELIRELWVPMPAPGATSAHTKFLPRSVEDYATVSVAVALDLEPSGAAQDPPVCRDCRIVLACVGATPVRADKAEAELIGKPFDAERCQAAGVVASAATDPMSDTRGSSTYKRKMAAVFVRRTLLRAAARLDALGAEQAP